jgi:hypothetical protein
MGGVFVLTYRDSLNVLILYGRCRVTLARAIELIQNLNTQNVLKIHLIILLSVRDTLNNQEKDVSLRTETRVLHSS